MESTQILLTQIIDDLQDVDEEQIPGAPQLVEVARLTINGVDHSVWNRVNTIGRASDCDIIIKNEAVSSKHAIIEADTYGIHKITDLGSANKTRINGVIIPPKVPNTIENGAKLTIANVTAIYHHSPLYKTFPLDKNTSPQSPSVGVCPIPVTPELRNASSVGHIPETPDSKSESESKSEEDIFGIDSSMYSTIDFECNAAVELADAQSKITVGETSNSSNIGCSKRAPSPDSSPDNSQDIVAGSQPLFCSERENEKLIIQTAEPHLAVQPEANDWDDFDAPTQLRNFTPSREIELKTSLSSIGDKNDEATLNNGDDGFSQMLTQPRNLAQPSGKTPSNDLVDMGAATKIRNPSSAGDTNRGEFRLASSPDDLSVVNVEEVGEVVVSSEGEESFADMLTQVQDPVSNFQAPCCEAPSEIDISDFETQQIVREVKNIDLKESRNIEDRIGAMNERNIYSAATQELMRSAIKRTTTVELLEMLENSEIPRTQEVLISKPIAPQTSQKASKNMENSDCRTMQPPTSSITKPSTSLIDEQPSRPGLFQSEILPLTVKLEKEYQSSGKISDIRPTKPSILNGEADLGNPKTEAPNEAEESFSQIDAKVRSPVTNRALHNIQIDISEMETQEIVPCVQHQSNLTCVKAEPLNDNDICSADTEDIKPLFEKVPSAFHILKEENPVVQSGESQSALRLTTFQNVNLTPQSRLTSEEKSTLSNTSTAKLPQTPSSEFELNIDDSISEMITPVRKPNNPELLSPKAEVVVDITDMETQQVVPQNPGPNCEKIKSMNDDDIFLSSAQDVTRSATVKESNSVYIENGTDDADSPMVEASQFPITREIKPIVYSDDDSQTPISDDCTLLKRQKKSDIPSSTNDTLDTGASLEIKKEGKLPSEELENSNTFPRKAVPSESESSQYLEGSQFPIARETKPLVYSDEDSPSFPSQMEVRSISPLPTKSADLPSGKLVGTSTFHSNPGSSTCKPGKRVRNDNAGVDDEPGVLNVGERLDDDFEQTHRIHSVDTSGIADMETQNIVGGVEDSLTKGLDKENGQLETIGKIRMPAIKKSTGVQDILVSKGAPDAVSGAIDHQVAHGHCEKLTLQKCEESIDTPPTECSQFPHKRVTKHIAYSDEDSPPTEPMKLKRNTPKKLTKANSASTNLLQNLDSKPTSSLQSPGSLKVGSKNISPKKSSVLEINSDEPLQPCNPEIGLIRSKSPSLSGHEGSSTTPRNAEENPETSKLKTVSPPELQTESLERPRKQAFMSSDVEKVQTGERSSPVSRPSKRRNQSGTPKKRPSSVKGSATSSLPCQPGAESNTVDSLTTFAELGPSSAERRERPSVQANTSCDAEIVKEASTRFELQSDEDSPPLTGRPKQRRKPLSPKKRPSAESSCRTEVVSIDSGPSTSSLIDLQAGSPHRPERPRKQAFMSCDAENVRKASLFGRDVIESDPKMPQDEEDVPLVNVKKFRRAPSTKQPSTNLNNTLENESLICNSKSPAQRQRKSVPHEPITPKIDSPVVSHSIQPAWTSPLSRRGKKLGVVQDPSEPNIRSASSLPQVVPPETPTVRRRGQKVNNTTVKPEGPPLPQRVSARVKRTKAALSSSLPGQDANDARPTAKVCRKTISTFKQPEEKQGSPVETLGSRRSSRKRKEKKSFEDLVLQKEQEIREKKISSQSPGSSAGNNIAQSCSENIPASPSPNIISRPRGRLRKATAVVDALPIASIETRNNQTSANSQDTTVSETDDSQSQTLSEGRRVPRQRRKKLSFDELVSQKEEEIKLRKNSSKSRRAPPSPVASTSRLQTLNSSVISPAEENVQTHRLRSSSERSELNSSCEPPPKRARNSQDTPNTSLARNSLLTDEPPRIMFTSHIDDSKLRTIVKKFGGRIVSRPKDCTVLITDKVRRTANFLSVLALGRPIVSPNWLSKCKAFNGFTDPNESLLSDHETEKTYKFSLADSLGKSQNRRLLKDYTIYVTPSVLPPPKEIQQIIECSGGQFEKKLPAAWPANAVVISNPNDSSSWRLLTKKGFCPPILSAEAILSGVLRQEFNPSENRLR